MVKILVGLYKDAATGQQVVDALLNAGFYEDDISLAMKDANVHSTESQELGVNEGAGFGALIGALVGIGSALVPGIGPLVGSGPLAVALTAGISAPVGALIGSSIAGLLDLHLNKENLAHDRNGLCEDSTIVSITTYPQWVEWAERIMTRYQPLKLEQREAEQQWSKFELDEEIPEQLDSSNVIARALESPTPVNSGVGIYEYHPHS